MAKDKNKKTNPIIDFEGTEIDLTKFNLKSEFSYYVALGALLDEHGSDLELYCQYPTDEHFFYEFFNKYPETL